MLCSFNLGPHGITLFYKNYDKAFAAKLLFFSNNKYKNDIKKLLDLKNLCEVQACYIYKATKVIVVYKHKNLIFTTF